MATSDWIPIVEERDNSFPIWVIDGETATAKTYTYVNFPYANGLAFSFDGQVKRVLNQFPERKPHWRVVDALHYYDVGEGILTAPVSPLNPFGGSAIKTHEYLRRTLRCYDADPDVRATIPKTEWRDPVEVVVFDGFQMISEIEEMRMRAKNKLGPFEGFANRGLWKTRRYGLRELVRAAERAATKAVVFTTYPQRVDVIKDGVLIETRSPPNWYDVIEKESGLWLRCEKDTDQAKGEDRFFITVKKSRFKSFPQGKRYQVPYGKTFTDVVGVNAFLNLENIGQPPPLPSDLAPIPTGAHVRVPDEEVESSDAATNEDDALSAFMGGSSGD